MTYQFQGLMLENGLVRKMHSLENVRHYFPNDQSIMLGVLLKIFILSYIRAVQ